MPDDTKTAIPIEWYIDEKLCMAEKHALLNSDFYYLGHASNVTHVGDYWVLPTTCEHDVMVKNDDHINIISNVCRHRQSQLLEGKGNTKIIVCPVHSWSYGIDGKGIVAHHFKDIECPSLEKTSFFDFQGMLFRTSSLAQEMLGKVKQFPENLSTYKVQSVEVLPCQYNWKIFMETYLDLYHISTIHPGLRKFANCKDIDWDLSDHSASQSVGVFDNADLNPSPHYKEYMRLLNKLYLNRKPQRITWLAFYPNVMIEFYPYNLVTSIVIPMGPESSLNVVEFLAPEELLSHPEGLAMHQAFKQAYLETAAEDDIACQKIQKGRDSLYRTEKEDYGPCHNPEELGIEPFYAHWNRYIKKAL